MNKKSLINQINYDVKLTKNVIIKPLETIETMGISKVPNHEKYVNVIIELSSVVRQGNEAYTVLGFNFLKAGSKWVGLALRKLSSKTINLKRGTVIVYISAANKVLSKLAPRIIAKASSVNVHPSMYPDVMVETEKESSNLDMP